MSDTVYGYFKAETPEGPGYVCIRLDRPAREAAFEKKYKFTYSFCSPKDQFSRKLARKIVDSRMTSVRKNCASELSALVYSDADLIAKNLLSAAFSLIDDKPRWLKKAKSVGRYYKSKK